MMEGEPEAFEAILHQLAALKVEHRDLDEAIARTVESPLQDELQVRRLKRRKLLLKDQIVWLQRQLEPDDRA
jgi:hypothetical protein